MLKPPSPLGPKSWKFRTKAIGLAIALGTLPVMITGAIAYLLANRSISKSVLQLQQDRASQLSNMVNRFMFERYGDIQVLASLAIFADPRVSSITSSERKQATLDRYLKVYKVYDSIAIADLQGNTLLQSSGAPVTGLGERDYFREVLKTNGPVITPPRKSALTGEYSIFAAAPIQDVTTGQTIAIIRSRTPVKVLTERFNSDGSIYVTDASGQFFIAPNFEEIGSDATTKYAFLSQRSSIKQADVRIATSQRSQAQKVVAIAPTEDIEGMPNLDWMILVDIDTATAFQTQQDLLLTLLLGTGVTALVVSGIAVWFASRTTQSINTIVDTIATSSEDIAVMAEEQESTAAQQSIAVNQTTSTLDELRAASQQSAQQAASAAVAAQQVLSLAQGGHYTVGQALESIHLLKTKVGAIAEQTAHLSDQTHQISSISNLVGDLANQTNMLALNAAVEAARAGEHGRGFTVVASEIRKLADQSKQSVTKIQSLVTDIQTAIQTTVMVTDEGTHTADTGMQRTEETTQAFTGVVAAIDEIVLNSQQISLTAKQQAIAIQQIVTAMNTLNQGAIQTADGIRQAKVGTHQLNEVVLQLKTMV